MTRLAIVGSVSLAGSKEAESIIRREIARIKPTFVVSGGAKGIDSMGVAIAKELGIPTQEYLPATPNWAGYKPRNLLIAQNCDVLLRIASKTSRTYGSGWTRDRAKELGVECLEYKL